MTSTNTSNIERVARTIWHTGSRSGVGLSIVAVFALLAFAVASGTIGKARHAEIAAAALWWPAFFWWVVAGEFLVARTPASSLALVPGYRATHAAIVGVHLAFTTLVPTAVIAALGGDWASVLCATVFGSGLGAYCGGRGAVGLLVMMTAAALVLWLSAAAPATKPQTLAFDVRAFTLVVGIVALAAWWREGIGGRPERRWQRWLAEIARAQRLDAALRHGTGGPLPRWLERIDDWLNRQIDALTIARFLAARTPARRSAMLALGFGELPRRLTITALIVGVFYVFLVVVIATIDPADGRTQTSAFAAMAAFLHAFVCWRQAKWLSSPLREPELLKLVPGLGGQGTLAARAWIALHVRFYVLSTLTYAAVAAWTGAEPLRIVYDLLWLALMAAVGLQYSSSLLVRRKQPTQVAVELLVMTNLLFGLLMYGRVSNPQPTAALMVAAIAAALVLARIAYRDASRAADPLGIR